MSKKIEEIKTDMKIRCAVLEDGSYYFPPEQGLSMDSKRLEEIKSRVKGASGPPWFTKDWWPDNPGVFISRKSRLFDDWDECREEDADFIAHAREDIPWLIKELEKLKDFKRAYCALVKKHTEDLVDTLEDEVKDITGE